jgi:hypothetical protein
MMRSAEKVLNRTIPDNTREFEPTGVASTLVAPARLSSSSVAFVPIIAPSEVSPDRCPYFVEYLSEHLQNLGLEGCIFNDAVIVGMTS